MVRRRLALLLLAAAPAWASATAGAEPPGVAAAPPPLWEDALPPGPSLAERLEEIRRRVQEAVVYPPRARSNGTTGVTRIRFEIAQNGLASGIRTVETSGSRLLDRAAEQGAVDAGELPRVYGRVEIPIRFELLRGWR
jgi:TonB family protein